MIDINKQKERLEKYGLMARVASDMDPWSRSSDRRMGKSNLVAGFVQNLLANDIYKKYEEKKYMKFNELKGGSNIMETKSRYEVIAELEEKKRNLIINRDNLPGELQAKEKELKILKREVEDKEEENKEFKEAIESQTATINELIKSTDDSLNRFAELGKKKS